MARPTIKQLYGLDPSTLKDLPATQYHARKIELLKIRRKELGTEMRRIPPNDGWEKAQAIDAELKYIEKAITANEKDLADLNGEAE